MSAREQAASIAGALWDLHHEVSWQELDEQHAFGRCLSCGGWINVVVLNDHTQVLGTMDTRPCPCKRRVLCG